MGILYLIADGYTGRTYLNVLSDKKTSVMHKEVVV
jgi:hypothetical protein